MGSVFPQNLDTDLEIEAIEDNLTEIGGETINALRSAVFMIERAIGTNPQGNKNSLKDRLAVSIDNDGKIKSSAIEELGLVSLPITNSHIAFNAGIEESKLNLDFSTQSLENSINSLATDIGGLQNGIAVINQSLSLHYTGTGNFHDGYDILINQDGGDEIGLAGFSGTTVGDVLVELSTLLVAGDETKLPHIDLELLTAKHRASEIGVDTTNFKIIDRAAENVQTALDSIDTKQGAFGEKHLDTFHSNGILREIQSGEEFNENQELATGTNADFVVGTSVITLPGLASFSSLGIIPSDILEITTGDNQGTYQIRAIGPLTLSETLGDLPVLASDQLAIFHTFSATESSVEFSIYHPASTLTNLAPLACSVRNNETIVDGICILNPNAARVVSLGFNGAIINGDGYELCVRVGLGNGQSRELTIPNLNLERLNTNQANPVDAGSVAERINAYVSDPTLGFHFPVSAFKVGNELAIAHNLVGADYTLEILDGYNVNYALGLDSFGSNLAGKIIKGNLNNSFVVNGVEGSTIRTVFEGHATITSATDTFALLDDDNNAINPISLGIGAGSVIHITGHDDLEVNGSYTIFTSTTTTISLFASEQITAPTNPTTFSVLITDANISLEVLENGESEKGVGQILINAAGEVFTNQRLMYGNSLGPAIDIIGVSDTFPVGDVNLFVDVSGDLAEFSVISNSFSGVIKTIEEDFKGIFKVYHPNNLDYLTIKTTYGVISGGIETAKISAPLQTDEVLQLCFFHFDGVLEITEVIDSRLFGNLGTDQIRDDLVQDLTQKPISELRSNGVVRGFDVLDIPFYDTQTGMQALPVQGGVAYVQGARLAVETQKVLIQSYDENQDPITGTKIIGINRFGSVQVFNDLLGEFLVDGYDSDATYGKILPLYQVQVVNGELTDFIDLRLFINSLDAKLELIVDETNNVVGNFRTLEGALLYASTYPNNEHLTIKIINAVNPTRAITVPNGISIIGSSPFGGNGKHSISNTNQLNASFITLMGNNRLENIEIVSQVATMNGALVEIAGNNSVVEKCALSFNENITTTTDDVGILITSATQQVQITNNKIDQVYSGIVALGGVNDLEITNNQITNLEGIGGASTSDGIKVGSVNNTATQINITNNTIKVPSIISVADIRGISANVGFTIQQLNISNNSIIHDALNTMTNGVRIENEDATGNQIENLIISGNTISGIKLDANEVYGIYIDSVETAKITNNIIKQVGVLSNLDIIGIEIGSAVDYAELTNNTLQDCDLTVGLEITSAGKVIIANNTLITLGTSAFYITGDASNSVISDNILVGPGGSGIRWTGTNTQISDNHLSQPADLSDYAFETYGIFVNVSDCNITNNTITGMVFNSGSIGISNNTTTRTRTKIIGNTITGSNMSRGIELFGDYHAVNNNRIFNYSNSTTSLINLNTVTNSLIMGNVLQGDATYGIHDDTSLTGTTISNNIFDPSIGSTGIMSYALEITDAFDCFVAGNKLPVNGTGITFDSLIGTSTALQYGSNVNTIGISSGLKDITTIPFSDAETAYDGSNVPHFVIGGTNPYWILGGTGSVDRRLYFPIKGLPQGSKLLSAQAYGNKGGAGTLTIQAFRKRNSDLSTENVSNADTITTATFGIIGDADGLVATTLNNANGEPIDYYNFSYYVLINHTGGSASITDIKIHGLKLIYRY